MKRIFILIAVVVVSGIAVLSGSCNKAGDKVNTAQIPLTLYDSLGGNESVPDPSNAKSFIEKGRLAIRSVVDSAIFIIAGDTVINGYFNVLLMQVDSNDLSGFEALSKNLTDFISIAAGAKDYKYIGLSMSAAHDPAQNGRISSKVDSTGFNAFEADLAKACYKCSVPASETAHLAALVESLRGTIVQR